MKTKKSLSRRSLLQGTAAIAGAAAASRLTGGGLFSGTAHAQSLGGEKPALVVVFLEGGYNALFSSADSFAGDGTFGVSGNNQLAVGNGLVVDSTTFGTFSQNALSHMATVGVRHGLNDHGAAQRSLMGNGTRSYLLMLANALGGDAAIKAVNAGSRMPAGPTPAENGVSLQVITDMGSTIAALGGVFDPTIPDRKIAAEALVAAQAMSDQAMAQSPVMLTSTRDGYNTGIDTLRKPVQQFNYATLAQAYGINANQTTVTNFTTQIVAAELMITAGANVVYVEDGGWDTHGDRDGSNVRNMMGNRIMPPLRTFVDRMLAQQERNVVVAIVGDFARSLPGSDHASAMSATVIGKYVANGTTGKMSAQVGLPQGTPGSEALWAYLSKALKSPSEPFGANPHQLLL